MENIYGIYKEGYSGFPKLIQPLYTTEKKALGAVKTFKERDERIGEKGSFHYTVELISII